MKKWKLFIDNSWVDPSDGEYFSSRSPATGEVLGEYASANAADVRKACDSSRSAFDGWSRLDPDRRAEIMLKAAAIMRKREKELARLEALDTGKPISETANFDIPFSILAFEYFANLAREVQGHVIPTKNEVGNKEFFDFVTYEPYGVVAVLSPYNFPMHLLTRSLCPAIAAGNTAVCKASSITPATTAVLGEIILEAGFPAGVVNIVSGPGNVTGEALASDAQVDVVGFTGSEAVGRRLIELSARSPLIKKLVLELGGKGPFIVEPDCDMEETIASTLVGLCYNQGQVCCAMTRLLVHEDIADKFLKLLARRMGELKMGDILDPDTKLGSLISLKHLENVDAQVKKAVENGAKLICGGERYTQAPCDKGAFYRPTILTDVKRDMCCWTDEIFGPVLVARRYKTIQEAVELANDTMYGLGANIFTRNYRTAYWTAKKLNAGSVWVNINNGAQISCPFGGNKNSGAGREYGVFGLHEYLKVKNNLWNMGDGIRW